MQGRSVSSPYLFSRLMKCAVCGANISIVSGKWRGRGDVVYGCPQNTYRGQTVCSNDVRIFRRALEEELLDGLQAQVMRPKVIDYVLAKFEAELTNAVDSLSGELEQMRQRKQELEREIGNLANFVAQGDCSPGLRAALVNREREIGDITGKLLEARPDSLQTKLRKIRALVESRMIKRETLCGFRNLASGGPWQYRWCRGPGLHRSLGFFLSPRRSMMPADEGGLGPKAASLRMRKNL